MVKMNKRIAASVSDKTRRLEAELTRNDNRLSSHYSVEAGRDIQTGLTRWQKMALGNQEQFAIRNGFRRRHPNHVLGQFGAAVKTNTAPKEKWMQYMVEEDKRHSLPETTKKARNEYAVNQLGLAETAVKNFVESREKLNAITLVGV
jgi:hypothetical protein